MSLLYKLNDAFQSAKTTIALQDEIFDINENLKLSTSAVLLMDSALQLSSGKPAQMACGLATKTLMSFDKTTLACMTNGLGQLARIRDKGFLRVMLEHTVTSTIGVGLYELMRN